MRKKYIRAEIEPREKLNHEKFLKVVSKFTNKFEYVLSIDSRFTLPAEVAYDFDKEDSLHIDYDNYKVIF